MSMRRIISTFVCALVILIAGASTQSCAVHEWPESLPARFVLDLDFDTALPPYTSMSYNVATGRCTVIRKAVDSAADAKSGDSETDSKAGDAFPEIESIDRPDYPSYLKMRVLVKAWDVSSDCSGTPLYEENFILDEVAEDTSIELAIPEGNYVFHVWADCYGPDDRLYYSADDFKSIGYLGDYVGGSEARDAYCGTASAEVRRLSLTQELERAEVSMGRPLARYQFISDDLEELALRVAEAAEAAAAEAAESAAAEGAGEAPVKSGENTKAVNLEDFKVVIYYTGYMPDKFNVFTSKPFDSRSGASFETVPRRISETESLMAFDYVMVNGKDASVVVKLALYTPDGQLISVTDNITVPLKRSRLTTIYGHFLTEYANGGVVIDPSYDGDDIIIML